MPEQSRSHQPIILQKCCQPRNRPACVTVTVLGFVIAAILLAFVAFGQDESSHATLRLVSVVFRHGDRTPTETYPTDPHREEDTWPEGWGALTKKGMQQMFNLGQFLRKRYNGYLSELYSPKEFLIKSSANDRCLMSAQVVLAGLYPPTGMQVWNPDLKWQPIPVHSTPRHLDQLIAMKKPCLRNQQELRKAYRSSTITELNHDNEDLYGYLTTHTGQNVSNITAVELLYNTLEIEDSKGLRLPEWTRSVYPEKMRYLAAISLTVFTYNEVLKRLTGGPLVGEITQNMENKRTGLLKSDQKMVLYSAHDLTIVNLWRALGFTDLIKPDYGASLVFELHRTRSGTSFEVKMLYLNNTATYHLNILNMPKCGQPCYLDTFLRLARPVVPEDWDQECQTTSGGAFEGVEDTVSPFGYKRGEGIDAGSGEPEWIVSRERYKYDTIFDALSPVDGKVTGAAAKAEMVKSKLPNSVLGKIWKLSDIDKDGLLDADEFALAMHLINIKLDGHDLPSELPDHLIPPSKRDM